tara:strand:- start:12468 stop:13031 length:564 start_codon:yes stop_codon:yes gene_type:complete
MVSVQIDSTTGSEIVGTSEIKSYARIETSADDSIVSILQKAARSACEDYINRDIVAKTRTYFRSNIPLKGGDYNGLYADRYKIVLPYAPINAITSVQTQNSDGTLSTANYDSYGFEDKYIILTGLPNEDIKIVYTTSGKSDDALKLAILQLASTYYDNRSDYVAGNISQIPTNVKKILDPFKYVSDI